MRFSKQCAAAIMLAAAATSAAPAIANSAKSGKAHAAAPQTKARAGKSMPDFGAILGMFDKLFPPQPDPDPARLALARIAVGAMWPDGAYGKMMTGFMGGMFDRVMQLKKSDFAALDSKAEKKPEVQEADLSLHDQAAAKDPYFDQRMTAIRGAIGEEVAKVSTIIDPRMRDGLARSMARRFDAQQLTDINGFFATPSGQALASQYMQLWMDPDTMRSLFGTLPEMMKLMPEMMQKIKAADDKFPKPPSAPKAIEH
jgi:hypothetical protein